MIYRIEFIFQNLGIVGFESNIILNKKLLTADVLYDFRIY